MRLTPAIAIAAAGYSNEFSPPPSSAAAVTCDPHHNCSTWRPYGSSKDFEANAAMILIVLLTAIICALALNAAIRCSSRYSRATSSDTNAQGRARKPNMVELVSDAQVVEPPKLVFSAGMKLAGAAAECAICLSEFVEGEGIRVLGDCNHGYHVHCIQQWLSSNSSCPTCRSTATCLPSLSSTGASISPTGPNSAPVMANS